MAYSRPPQIIKANGGALIQTPPSTVVFPPGIVPVELEAQIASKTQLGVVQIGDGIDVTPEGVISVSGSEAGCNTILVRADYESKSDDCYIGVNSSGPVTITLPVVVSDGHQIVVKAEMGPPIGNRKVTITTSDGALIDGSPTCVLSVPYESVHLIFRGFEWHII